MLKRKIYDELLVWKKNKKNECLLVKRNTAEKIINAVKTKLIMIAASPLAPISVLIPDRKARTQDNQPLTVNTIYFGLADCWL